MTQGAEISRRGESKQVSEDSNKSLNVITTAGPHELMRAEGPRYTSLAR